MQLNPHRHIPMIAADEHPLAGNEFAVAHEFILPSSPFIT
jgi:hypothetical protein